MPDQDGPEAASKAEPEAFELAGEVVAPGARKDIELRVERLPSGPWISIPAIVMHGRLSGPTLWVSAALHGDEINGVEIIRRLLTILRPGDLSGTIILVPVVNQLGFMAGERYLPDRRDPNRSFPGTPRGSLASRLANLFMREIVARCDYGIDLHCGSDDRINLPQIRADLTDPETARLAAAFCAPLTLDSQLRDGSLREAATGAGVRVLLFEGGEANRYNEEAVSIGVAGILRVIDALEMEPPSAPATSRTSSTAHSSRWVRASRAGLFRHQVELGDRVEQRAVLGHLSDIFGRQNLAVRASVAGTIIGMRLGPRVNQGDALFHIAQTPPPGPRYAHERD